MFADNADNSTTSGALVTPVVWNFHGVEHDALLWVSFDRDGTKVGCGPSCCCKREAAA